MKRTISGMVGKGSLGHNSRSFCAENVKQEKSSNNIVFCHENLKKVYADLLAKPSISITPNRPGMTGV